MRQSEPENSGTARTTEVSNVNPPAIPIVPSSQNNQNHQSPQSTVIGSLAYTQTRSLVISMADEMRLPIFRGDGSEDPY